MVHGARTERRGTGGDRWHGDSRAVVRARGWSRRADNEKPAKAGWERGGRCAGLFRHEPAVECGGPSCRFGMARRQARRGWFRVGVGTRDGRHEDPASWPVPGVGGERIPSRKSCSGVGDGEVPTPRRVPGANAAGRMPGGGIHPAEAPVLPYPSRLQPAFLVSPGLEPRAQTGRAHLCGLPNPITPGHVPTGEHRVTGMCPVVSQPLQWAFPLISPAAFAPGTRRGVGTFPPPIAGA